MNLFHQFRQRFIEDRNTCDMLDPTASDLTAEEQQLVQRLKSLRTLQPSPQYRQMGRARLLRQIAELEPSSLAPREPSRVSSFFPALGFFHSGRFHLPHVARYASAMLLLLLVLCSASYTAIGRSRPGEYLYPVKTRVERVQIAFAPPEQRPFLLIRLTERRLEELEQAMRLHPDEKPLLLVVARSYCRTVAETTERVDEKSTTVVAGALQQQIQRIEQLAGQQISPELQEVVEQVRASNEQAQARVIERLQGQTETIAAIPMAKEAVTSNEVVASEEAADGGEMGTPDDAPVSPVSTPTAFRLGSPERIPDHQYPSGPRTQYPSDPRTAPSPAHTPPHPAQVEMGGAAGEPASDTDGKSLEILTPIPELAASDTPTSQPTNSPTQEPSPSPTWTPVPTNSPTRTPVPMLRSTILAPTGTPVRALGMMEMPEVQRTARALTGTRLPTAAVTMTPTAAVTMTPTATVVLTVTGTPVPTAPLTPTLEPAALRDSVSWVTSTATITPTTQTPNFEVPVDDPTDLPLPIRPSGLAPTTPQPQIAAPLTMTVVATPTVRISEPFATPIAEHARESQEMPRGLDRRQELLPLPIQLQGPEVFSATQREPDPEYFSHP